MMRKIELMSCYILRYLIVVFDWPAGSLSELTQFTDLRFSANGEHLLYSATGLRSSIMRRRTPLVAQHC